MELANTRYVQWCAQQNLEPELRQELAAMQGDEEKITDAFYRDLEFGTAGLRGVLGAGTNRMNLYVIRRATQAVAAYLNETDLPKTAMTAASRAMFSRARRRRCLPRTASRPISIPGWSRSRR